jgi:hypothetical protein
MRTTASWAFWSIVLYILCSCGYIVFDILSIVISLDSSTLNRLYTILAAALVAEAIFYTIDWFQYVCCQEESAGLWEYKFKFIASIFHNIGSVGYLLGAIFGENTGQNQQDLFSNPQLYIFNIIGMGALIIESIFTLIGWMLRPPNKKRCHCSPGVALWAHLLNILGGVICLVESILPLILTNLYSTKLTQTTLYLNYVRPVQIAGDGVYLIDSLLYMILWFQERKQKNKISNDGGPSETQGRGTVFLRYPNPFFSYLHFVYYIFA